MTSFGAPKQNRRVYKKKNTNKTLQLRGANSLTKLTSFFVAEQQCLTHFDCAENQSRLILLAIALIINPLKQSNASNFSKMYHLFHTIESAS